MSYQDADAPSELAGYLGVLWRRRVVVAACCLVALALAYVVTLLTPKTFSAQVDVLLSNQSYLLDTSAVATELQVLTSGRLVQRVDELLGAQRRRAATVDAETVRDTRVITITASSRSPEVARDAANSYATAYLSYRQGRAQEVVAMLERQLQPRIDEAERRLAAVDRQVDDAAGRSSPALAGLQQERATISTDVSSLRETLSRSRVDTVMRQTDAEVISEAELPTSPSSPRPARNLALGALLGLTLGAGVAFVRQSAADTRRPRPAPQPAF